MVLGAVDCGLVLLGVRGRTSGSDADLLGDSSVTERLGIDNAGPCGVRALGTGPGAV